MAKDVGERFAETALDQRAVSYRWLRKNHEKIAAVFATQTRPSWKALAVTAAESGVPCSADTLRKAWLRLQVDLSKIAAPPKPKPALASARVVVPGAPLRPLPGSTPALPSTLTTQPTKETLAHVQPGRPSSFAFSATPKENDSAIWKGTKPKPE